MKKIGIAIAENPMPVDGVMHISMITPCPQVIVLFEEYEKLQEEKALPLLMKMLIEWRLRMLCECFMCQ